MKIKLNIRKQPILLLFIATLLQCFLSTSTFAQNLSLKNANGNGALFDGTSITLPELSFNSKTIANMTSTPIAAYDEVYVSFALKPTPSKYRYNGKVYTSGTLTGKCVCDFGLRTEMKMTATVNLEGKTYTGTVDKATIGGVLATRVTIKLPNAVKSGSKISIISITVEALPSPHAEEVIRRYEKCLQNEKERNDAAEKEKAKKETTKTDDDFWNGGKSETEKKEMVIVTPTISNDDFWSGKEEKPKVESEEKEKKEEEELTHYAYLVIYQSGCTGLPWEDVYYTNVFKIPKNVIGVDGRYFYDSTEIKKKLFKDKVKEFLNESFPNVSKKCFEHLFLEWTKKEDDNKSRLEEKRTEKSETVWIDGSKGLIHFIDGFYPYGE